MKKVLTVSVGIAALTLAQLSFANVSTTPFSWTTNVRAPNVTKWNTENSNFIKAPVSVRRGSKITSVSWNVGAYANGATTQTFEICWAAWNTANYTKCLDISSSLVTTSSFFNGLDAKGAFKIKGILMGGTYPVYPSHRNTITVNHQLP